MKRYMNMALVYAILAMVGGVFYREFTKFNGFTGRTTLGVVHTHYFLLGMVFFLLLLLLGKELFLHRSQNRPDTGCLSDRPEPYGGDVCGTGRDPGAGNSTFLGYECGHFWYGRDWSYFAGCQPGASAGADQAQRVSCEGLIREFFILVLAQGHRALPAFYDGKGRNEPRKNAILVVNILTLHKMISSGRGEMRLDIVRQWRYNVHHNRTGQLKRPGKSRWLAEGVTLSGVPNRNEDCA